MGPSHHGMARTRDADGRDDLQTWRVAGNIVNKQSRTEDKRVVLQLGVLARS